MAPGGARDQPAVVRRRFDAVRVATDVLVNLNLTSAEINVRKMHVVKSCLDSIRGGGGDVEFPREVVRIFRGVEGVDEEVCARRISAAVAEGGGGVADELRRQGDEADGAVQNRRLYLEQFEALSEEVMELLAAMGLD
jgi:hypothetical protein